MSYPIAWLRTGWRQGIFCQAVQPTRVTGRTSSLCVLFALLVISLPVSANIGAVESLAIDVAQKSGMVDMIASYPEQISAHIHQNTSAKRSPMDQSRAIDMLLKAYNSLDTNDLLVRYIQEHVSPQALHAINDWFESDLGTRFSAAEKAVSTVQGQLGERDYLAGLKKHGPTAERVRLIRQFESAAALRDINMDMIALMMKSEMAAMNRLLPAEKRKTDTELSAQLEKELGDIPPVMSAMLKQQMLDISEYTYRDFTDDELTDYIRFLESDAGKVLVGLYRQAPEFVFDKVIEKMER